MTPASGQQKSHSVERIPGSRACAEGWKDPSPERNAGAASPTSPVTVVARSRMLPADVRMSGLLMTSTSPVATAAPALAPVP